MSESERKEHIEIGLKDLKQHETFAKSSEWFFTSNQSQLLSQLFQKKALKWIRKNIGWDRVGTTNRVFFKAMKYDYKFVKNWGLISAPLILRLKKNVKQRSKSFKSGLPKHRY